MVNKKVWIISAVVLFVVIVLGLILFTPSKLTCSGSTPNECNGQCWSNCTTNQIFKCEISGGMCGADPNNCPSDAPNSCNNQCWSNCTTNQIFRCETSGGTCIADPNNCPANAPNSCNGQCWSCKSGEKFTCDAALGGTCQKK